MSREARSAPHSVLGRRQRFAEGLDFRDQALPQGSLQTVFINPSARASWHLSRRRMATARLRKARTGCATFRHSSRNSSFLTWSVKPITLLDCLTCLGTASVTQARRSLSVPARAVHSGLATTSVPLVCHQDLVRERRSADDDEDRSRNDQEDLRMECLCQDRCPIRRPTVQNARSAKPIHDGSQPCDLCVIREPANDLNQLVSIGQTVAHFVPRGWKERFAMPKFLVGSVVAALVVVLTAGSASAQVEPRTCGVFGGSGCLTLAQVGPGQRPQLLLGTRPVPNARTVGPLNTLNDLWAAPQARWVPPLLENARPGMQMTLWFSFNRDGGLICPPQLTYATPEMSVKTREIYREPRWRNHCAELHAAAVYERA